MKSKPEIIALLRTGSFYVALTKTIKLLDIITSEKYSIFLKVEELIDG